MNGGSGGARKLSMEFGWAFCGGSCRISALSSYDFTAPRDSLISVLTLTDWRNRGAGHGGGTPFTVDAFRCGCVQEFSAYFLTLSHADHYTGII
ncbi:unnamed protein product [Arabis nemorensis]|uniref:Uncharacterized protein n=1 Tax=Arabis nemorensis TaxID=586526 RepID=A0A565BR19_9BRAS|nr:unnamed protein product [Arabis nemorensis]